MVTWRTYGTWLQGDKRGFLKNGKLLPPDSGLNDINRENLQKPPVNLSPAQTKIVIQAIKDKAEKLSQNILALSVCQNHVHLLIAYDGSPIESSVRVYKNAALVALRKLGFSGRLWSSGYHKRFCFDRKTLRTFIEYVQNHDISIHV